MLYGKKITSARFDDLEEIYEIEKESFISPWDKRQILNEIDNTLTLSHNDEIFGFITYWIIVDEIHIIDLAVREKYRRQGIAKKLIKEVIKKHKEDCRCIWLEVRTNNIAALELYKSLHFEHVLIRKRYYEKEDAIILMKQI